MTTVPHKPFFSSNCHLDVLLCLGLVLAVFIPYHQVAGHRFIEYDDGIYAFYNYHIIMGLSWDSVCWAFTNVDAANWHPLTWISHLVDRELFGAHAGAYLLENVAWHALASCLCYLTFRQATGSRLFAFSVALIFAVHPANVENVAWLSERKSLLNALFWFCALIAYLNFIEVPSFRAYGVTVIAHLLSLLSKPMSVTLPCTLILIHVLYLIYHPDRCDFALQWRSCFRRFLLPVLPLFAISAYFSVVTISAQSVALANDDYALSNRLINVLLSYGRYLEMFFHPTGLALFYPLFKDQLTFRAAIPVILVLTAITACTLGLVRRKPQLLIGWCWFLGTMVPAIGVVQVGSQSHADRYLYIPMLGLAFFFPVLFEELRSISSSAKKAVAGVSVGVLSLSMILATQIQVSYWKDGVTLFSHSLAVTGDCLTSVINLAVAYHRAERFDDLIALCESKIKIAKNPNNLGKLAALKASALANTHRYEAAVESAQKSLSWGDTSTSNYWVLAISYANLGQLDKAAEYLKKAEASQKATNELDYVGMNRRVQMLGLKALLKSKTDSGPESRSKSPAASTDPANRE